MMKQRRTPRISTVVGLAPNVMPTSEETNIAGKKEKGDRAR